jgi:hypothetical protein
MRSSGLADDPGFSGRELRSWPISTCSPRLILGGLLIGFAALKSVAAHSVHQTAMVLLFLVLIVFIMEVSYWENVNRGSQSGLEASYAVPAVHAAIGVRG